MDGELGVAVAVALAVHAAAVLRAEVLGALLDEVELAQAGVVGVGRERWVAL